MEFYAANSQKRSYNIMFSKLSYMRGIRISICHIPEFLFYAFTALMICLAVSFHAFLHVFSPVFSCPIASFRLSSFVSLPSCLPLLCPIVSIVSTIFPYREALSSACDCLFSPSPSTPSTSFASLYVTLPCSPIRPTRWLHESRRPSQPNG